MLEVGRVVKPHGLAGEVIVELVTNRTDRMTAGAVFDADGGPLEIVRVTPHLGRYIVSFAGVAGREGAEALRGRVLRAEPIDDPDELWVHDLVGATVVGIDGTTHGTVDSVEANPASDLLVLDTGGLVPLRFVVTSEPGRVVIDPPAGLLDQ